MNLATKFLTVRRDRLLMRLGCWLVCFSLIVGLMLPQQRVYAVEPLTMTAVSSLAGAYLGSCGLSLVVSGMDSNGLVSNIQRLIQEFLDTELGGISIQDWLVGVWDLSVIAGKIFMGRPLTNEFVSFAQWVAGKYATVSGVNSIFSGEAIKLADGSEFVLTEISSFSNGNLFVASFYGDSFYLSDLPLYFEGFRLEKFLDGSVFWLRAYSDVGSEMIQSTSTIFVGSSYPLFLGYDTFGRFAAFRPWNFDEPSGYYDGMIYAVIPDLSFPVVKVGDLVIDRASSIFYIPEGIEAEQGIALDVGAAATIDHDQVLQSVLDKTLTGTLSPTMEVAGEAVVNPPAEEIADVEGLGLPTLGAALTSRFPFSIPWDFFRAVQLLAAPAKAPYFEVDFMEPLADKVGGWQGSTKVVLDFGQYAIIGQISRWTSTIGFCLMLAGSTKRLIWTA